MGEQIGQPHGDHNDDFDFTYFAGDEVPGEHGYSRDDIYQAAMTDEEIALRQQQEIAAFRKLYDVRNMNQEQLDALPLILQIGDFPDYVLQHLIADLEEMEVQKAVEDMHEEPVTINSITHSYLVAYILQNPTDDPWLSRLAAHLQNGGGLTKPQVDSAYQQMAHETAPDSDRAA
jgi:hypothetical protein